MHRNALTGILAAAAVAISFSSADAQPPWKRGGYDVPPGQAKKMRPYDDSYDRERHDHDRERHRHHRERRGERVVYYDGGGPPPWAPAYGYRRKHEREYEHEHEHEHARYVAPYGIASGHCNRERIGQILGGVAGAAIGSQIGKGTGKDVAIVAGTILGVILGGQVGRDMDQADRACVGQVLEHAPNGETVKWNTPRQDATYRVTPTKTYRQENGTYCREYTTTATVGGRQQQSYGTACRQPDGSWKIVS